MKKLFIITAVVTLLLSFSIPQKNLFKITGSITNYPANILIIAYQQDNGYKLDTIQIKNGKLSYQKELTDTIVASIVSRDENNNIKMGKGLIPGESITVLMTPGATLNLDIDNRQWPVMKLNGGQPNNDLMRLYAKTLPLKKEAFDIVRQTQKEGVSETEKETLQKKRSALREEIEKLSIAFVKENADSYAALHLFSGMRNSMPLTEYINVFNRTNVNLQKTALGQQISEYIKTARASEVGAPAPDFKKVDKDGKTVQLADYKGKYLLLDFWGSWCDPCRASHPHLKELQKHYAPKGLEVINIAQENGANSRAIWLKAVEEDQLDWTQILNNEGKKECDMVKLYGITAFPTKVLIDPSGKIIVKSVGESAPIDNKLKEVLGE